ncbi:MAG: VTT domain-containing protein [Calditrichia bacterium]|nr:VTT domain-containing protein [Calditrichia bacterium]MCK5454474.1 VTT domain-containing protein [Calditrichia bacterium]
MLKRISIKWYFVILSLLIATLSGIVVYYFYPEYIGLAFLFFYIIPSNSFIPFPHEPAIIFYGKIFGPLLTTLTAIIPTIIACIIDYAVLTPVFFRTRVSRMKDTRIYQKTVYYYQKAPFFTNFMAAISPVPFYPVRVLSVSSAYPLWKYTSSVLLGRIPRYFILALFGDLLNIPNWVILFFFVSLISVPIYQKLSTRGKKSDVTTDDEATITPNLSASEE